MPNMIDYQVDQVLTNMSIEYKGMPTIGEILMPRLAVKTRTGFYYKFDNSHLRVEDDSRTGVSRAKRVDYPMAKVAYGPLNEHSLEEAVEWDIRDTYPTPHDAFVDATESVNKRLILNHENTVAGILTNTSVLTQNVTLSGTSQFSDFANSDPYAVFQTAFDTIVKNAGVMPNTVAMGYEVWAKLRHHPDLLGRMAVNVTRTITPEQLAGLLGVERVLVGGALENNAAEGQTKSMGHVWGKDIVVTHVTSTPGLREMSLGYTLDFMSGRQVDRWSEPQVKSDFVRSTMYYEAKVVAAEAGYLIKAAVA